MEKKKPVVYGDLDKHYTGTNPILVSPPDWNTCHRPRNVTLRPAVAKNVARHQTAVLRSFNTATNYFHSPLLFACDKICWNWHASINVFCSSSVSIVRFWQYIMSGQKKGLESTIVSNIPKTHVVHQRNAQYQFLDTSPSMLTEHNIHWCEHWTWIYAYEKGWYRKWK